MMDADVVVCDQCDYEGHIVEMVTLNPKVTQAKDETQAAYKLTCLRCGRIRYLFSDEEEHYEVA